jgi:hypothetical protein
MPTFLSRKAIIRDVLGPDRTIDNLIKYLVDGDPDDHAELRRLAEAIADRQAAEQEVRESLPEHLARFVNTPLTRQ